MTGIIEWYEALGLVALVLFSFFMGLSMNKKSHKEKV